MYFENKTKDKESIFGLGKLTLPDLFLCGPEILDLLPTRIFVCRVKQSKCGLGHGRACGLGQVFPALIVIEPLFWFRSNLKRRKQSLMR